MKKILVFGAIILMASLGVKAAPGDTTWVQANDVRLTYNNNYDTAIRLPDNSKSYRKILLIFTLGKYVCPGYDPNNAGDKPGQTGWCGDWDYTVRNILMTPKGDTMEIGRFITPYARETSPRTPQGWTQRYTFDVTDFYTVLRDTGTVRIAYSGYSGGFTADVKFAYIEGTPPRNVIGVDNIWRRSYAYGKTPSIEDRIPSVNNTAPANTISSELMLTVSGHGSDATNCSEFCRKFYEVTLNKNNFDKTVLWRDDCGSNHLYPQSGTWVTNRGNWCPGDVVFPNRHLLAGVTASSQYDIDLDFEDYTSTSGNASYIIGGNVFYYGAFNKTTDVELEDVVAPNNHEKYYRYNPFTGRPIVIIRNTGSNTITSVKFQYEILGASGKKEYTWNGSLASLDTAWVELEALHDLYRATGNNNKFSVEVTAVNGGADDDASNNKFNTTFVGATTIIKDFEVIVQTNKGLVNGLGETSWRIVDMYNNIVAAEKKNLAANQLHRDTINLTVGMYKLEVQDAGCEGLRWWANPNDGNGFLSLRPAGSPSGIILDGYLAGDFGCGFTQYLNVVWPASITEVNGETPTLEVFPNPAQSSVSVTVNGEVEMNGQVQIADMTGRVVLTKTTTRNSTRMNVSSLPNGVYTVTYTGTNDNNVKLVSRLVIAN